MLGSGGQKGDLLNIYLVKTSKHKFALTSLKKNYYQHIDFSAASPLLLSATNSHVTDTAYFFC